jgi:hypothetical protein
MAAKTCPTCRNRPMYTGKGPGVDEAPRLSGMCNFCYTEGGWENTHNDYGHDVDGEAIEQAGQDEAGKRVDGCWICYPELNLAAKPRNERAGTSRAGMRLTVPVRAGGKAKAEAVKAQLPTGYTATIRTEKGRTTLRAKGAVTLVIHWDVRGAFVSGTAQATNGTAKRVRNASEALRAAGV